MARYRWHEHQWITDVARHRGFAMDGDGGSRWRLRGGQPGLGWTVTLTPASGEIPPQIRWQCPDLRAGDDPRKQLVVRPAERGGISSLGDLGDSAAGLAAAGAIVALGTLLRRRTTKAEPRTHDATSRPHDATSQTRDERPPGPLGPLWTVTDPCGVIDADLVAWFTRWPVAWWGPGDERPARLDSVWLNQRGLELTADNWWCSSPALDQLIGLGSVLSTRLRAAGC